MGAESKTNLEQHMPYMNGAQIRALTKLLGSEDITVNNVSQNISVSVFETRMTTAHANSVAKLPAGDFPGQRKHIVLDALGTAGDEVAVTPADGVTWKQANGSTDCASVTFAAADKYLLVEWNGARWTNLATDATVA